MWKHYLATVGISFTEENCNYTTGLNVLDRTFINENTVKTNIEETWYGLDMWRKLHEI